MFQNPYSSDYMTRPDKREEQAGTLRCGDLQISLTNPCLRKHGATLADLSCVMRRSLCPQNSVFQKYMHIFAGNKETFCLVSAFSFTSCYNLNALYYRNLECRNTTV